MAGVAVTLTHEIEVMVTPTDKYMPLTGEHATEVDIDGWIWDRRAVIHSDMTESRYDTYVGGHIVGLRDGVNESYWQSGSVVGCTYLETIEKPDHGHNLWVPTVEAGYYTIYAQERSLFSDYSYFQNISSSPTYKSETLYQSSVGTEEVRPGSIEVALWTRDEDSQISKHWDFTYVDEFTGELSGGSRLSTGTVVGGAITWANVSDRYREFAVDITASPMVLYTNQDYRMYVPDMSTIPSAGTTKAQAVPELWESKGSGFATGRTVYSEFFPIESSTDELATIDSGGTVTFWTRTTDLGLSGPTDQHYTIDEDLGIFEIGGFIAPELVLATGMDLIVTTVEVYLDDESMEQYPHAGTIQIGSEQITYTGKTRTTFTGCTRGANATVAAVHAVGDIVQDVQHGVSTTDDIYIKYTAVPRIEYEITDLTRRSCNSNSWLNVKPSANVHTNEVLQLMTDHKHVDSLVLEVDRPLLYGGGNIYGPVYYGTDVCKFTATAYDSQENTVDDVDVTFKVVTGSGNLDSSGGTAVKTTNSLGEAYAFYFSPYDRDSIEKLATTVSHSGADTLMHVPALDSNLSVDDVWVFQILKHDEITGTVGHISEVDALVTVGPEYGGLGVRLTDLVDDRYENGWLYVVSGGVKYVRNINHIYETTDASGYAVSLLMIEETTCGSVADAVYLFEPEAVEWSPALYNGVRVILYEYDAAATHPLLNPATGAYTPVHPDSFNTSTNTFTFTGVNLPLPDPVDDTVNLGGYSVIAPEITSVVATVKCPMTGRVISSNEIRLQLELTAPLIGVDPSGNIPVGFTFVTSSYNVGAGLGGANFITINPAATGINSFVNTGSVLV